MRMGSDLPSDSQPEGSNSPSFLAEAEPGSPALSHSHPEARDPPTRPQLPASSPALRDPGLKLPTEDMNLQVSSSMEAG